MLSENLKNLRKAKGFSQEELAARLHVVRQTVSKWEKGRSVPDAELLVRLAEELDTTPAALLGPDLPPAAEADCTAEQLGRIAEQLAVKNRRARRIWKIVAGVLIAFGVCTLLLILLNFAAFRSISTETEAVVENQALRGSVRCVAVSLHELVSQFPGSFSRLDDERLRGHPLAVVGMECDKFQIVPSAFGLRYLELEFPLRAVEPGDEPLVEKHVGGIHNVPAVVGERHGGFLAVAASVVLHGVDELHAFHVPRAFFRISLFRCGRRLSFLLGRLLPVTGKKRDEQESEREPHWF